jgi:hypothetical protein
MEKFPSKRIVKIGIVVKDIERAAKKYAEIFNIPVPEIHQPKEWKQEPSESAGKEPSGKEPGTVFRGKKEKSRCITAIVKLEPIYIELIQPLDEPSPWTEFLRKKGPGVHYMAFEAPSGFTEVENFMAGNGMPIYHKTEKGTQRYGYFETADELGITVEFKEIDA